MRCFCAPALCGSLAPRTHRGNQRETPLNRISSHDYLTWSNRRDLFEKTGGDLRDDVTIYGAGEPDQVIARRTTPGLSSCSASRRNSAVPWATAIMKPSSATALAAPFPCRPGGGRPHDYHLR